MLSAEALPSLVDALRAGDDDEKRDALTSLAEAIDSSFGDDAAALCEFLRVAGCVSIIVRLLEHERPDIHQPALLLVGNIASEAVDVAADKTKHVLKRMSAFEKLLVHLFTDDWTTLVYALGALQNTCAEVEYVELMQEYGATVRLQEIVSSGDAQLEHFAKGCLANMRQVMLVKATRKQIQQQTEKAAAVLIQSDARRLIARKRISEKHATQTSSPSQRPIAGADPHTKKSVPKTATAPQSRATVDRRAVAAIRRHASPELATAAVDATSLAALSAKSSRERQRLSQQAEQRNRETLRATEEALHMARAAALRVEAAASEMEERARAAREADRAAGPSAV